MAVAGDIVALIGLKDTTTGDTLCDPENPVILEKMEFPEPVIKVCHNPPFPLAFHSLSRFPGSRRAVRCVEQRGAAMCFYLRQQTVAMQV